MKYDVTNRRIWFKGEILNVNDAKINVLAPTSQFGLNVFEGIPCYWNDEEKQLYAFRLDEHYDRLIRSAKLIQIDNPYSKDELKKALVDVVKANEYDENLSVRQTLFVDGFGSWGSADPVDMFVAPIPRGRTSAEYNKKGLNVCVTSWRRISAGRNRCIPLKSGISLAASVLKTLRGQPVSTAPSPVMKRLNELAMRDCMRFEYESFRSERMQMTMLHPSISASRRLKSSGVV